MACSKCNDKINIITRRKCAFCLHFFCSKCLEKLSPFKGTCAKCQLLKSGRFTQQQLRAYSVKELKSFLVSEGLWNGGCIEKEDLVVLVFQSVSKFTSSRDVELLEHQRKVQHMKEGLGQKLETSGHPQVDTIDTTQTNEEDNNMGEYDIYNNDVDDSDDEGFVILNAENTETPNRQSTTSSNPLILSNNDSGLSTLTSISSTIPPSMPSDSTQHSTLNSLPLIYPKLVTSSRPTSFSYHNTSQDLSSLANSSNLPPLSPHSSQSFVPTSSAENFPLLPPPPSYQDLFTSHINDNDISTDMEINTQEQQEIDRMALQENNQQQQSQPIQQQQPQKIQQQQQNQQQPQQIQQQKQQSQPRQTSPTLSGDNATKKVVKKNVDHILRIEELDDASDIEGLTVRQLKILLANNFVTYKGCCEKKELSILVNKLWQDRLKNQVEESKHSSNADVCKICMEHMIDCVLLECGHMVSCTSCSKRLHQCPVCRSLVSRVVHIFKA